eukprot:g82610.t1
MRIKVQDSFGSVTSLHVSPWATVKDVKDHLKDRLGIPQSIQRLFFRGLELRSRRMLDEVHVRDGCGLYLLLDGWERQEGLPIRIIGGLCPTELQSVLRAAGTGLSLGFKPRLASEGMGGTYFLRSPQQKVVAVFKAEDEEPFAPNNPRGYVGRIGQPGMRAGVRSGEGHLREVAAYLLDHGHAAGVPATARAEIQGAAVYGTNTATPRPGLEDGVELSLPGGVTLGAASRQFLEHADDSSTEGERKAKDGDKPKVGSLQAFVGSLQAFVESDELAGDLSSDLFPVDAVHMLAILDIRLVNSDRNEANILVKRAPDGECQLIPIDHSYALPDTLEITWADWTWLGWSQLQKPLSRRLREYVSRLDIAADVALLQERLAIRSPCLRLMRISGELLQQGVCHGFGLSRIAEFMCRADMDTPSDLEVMCTQARAMAQWQAQNVRTRELGPLIGKKVQAEWSKVLNGPCHSGLGGKAKLQQAQHQPKQKLDESNKKHKHKGDKGGQERGPAGGGAVGGTSWKKKETCRRRKKRNKRQQQQQQQHAKPQEATVADGKEDSIRAGLSEHNGNGDCDSSQDSPGNMQRKLDVQDLFSSTPQHNHSRGVVLPSPLLQSGIVLTSPLSQSGVDSTCSPQTERKLLHHANEHSSSCFPQPERRLNYSSLPCPPSASSSTTADSAPSTPCRPSNGKHSTDKSIQHGAGTSCANGSAEHPVQNSEHSEAQTDLSQVGSKTCRDSCGKHKERRNSSNSSSNAGSRRNSGDLNSSLASIRSTITFKKSTAHSNSTFRQAEATPHSLSCKQTCSPSSGSVLSPSPLSSAFQFPPPMLGAIGRSITYSDIPLALQDSGFQDCLEDEDVDVDMLPILRQQSEGRSPGGQHGRRGSIEKQHHPIGSPGPDYVSKNGFAAVAEDHFLFCYSKLLRSTLERWKLLKGEKPDAAGAQPCTITCSTSPRAGPDRTAA